MSATSACTVCVSLTSAPPTGCAGARLANCQSRTGGPLGQGIAACATSPGDPRSWWGMVGCPELGNTQCALSGRPRTLPAHPAWSMWPSGHCGQRTVWVQENCLECCEVLARMFDGRGVQLTCYGEDGPSGVHRLFAPGLLPLAILP